MLTLEIMQRMWPHGDQHVPGLLEGIATSALGVLPKFFPVNTDHVTAYFMANCTVECGAGLEMRENMNYTAQRLLQVFPSHFTTTLAAKAAHNPQMIAEIAYGGRMGNAPPPSTDGWTYRGGGLTNCTGKDGYAALQKWLDDNGIALDVLADPDLTCEPVSALMCGVGDFILCGCLPHAEAGDFVATCAVLNVGHVVPASRINGYADRLHSLGQWKSALNT
jgi:putative chitinase